MIRDLLEKYATGPGVNIDTSRLGLFEQYYALLREWNERVNLTALIEERDVAVKHFIDSLTLLKEVNPGRGARVVDVGTGAGFPGIPLKIARPDLHLTLVESVRKKTEFLTCVINSLFLSDVTVICARAEDAARRRELRSSFDFAFSRAVASLPVLLEYCLPLLKNGGLFVAMKGPAVVEETKSAGNALQLLGGLLERIVQFKLPFSDEDRSLVLVKKIMPTPDKFPRRAGLPARRPL
ncbi:16S rRNA (guanine(527)-N(7))-methyltransferase RsmG [Desulfotomaculum copahuensis]|uniref:Ribosomal RNA small subunit methyltransferase G n=1 Tax=Desulfotomaculum copahuensis TaxID=1838280 RepID=A0A1B7LBG2_9FIRM|nr:16S rRNA (guanine(527)-N(7))-methyltransferase RsmG [Desulfotomaculum copahuensis]OAT79882.1 hypothetical protein A6M21_14635 [Desulfotomaculum copahuensis]